MMRGRPSCLLQSAGGEANRILLASALSCALKTVYSLAILLVRTSMITMYVVTWVKENTHTCISLALTASDPLLVTTELASNLDSIASSSCTDNENISCKL